MPAECDDRMRVVQPLSCRAITQRSPRSPWPFFAFVFALRRRRLAVEPDALLELDLRVAVFVAIQTS